MKKGKDSLKDLRKPNSLFFTFHRFYLVLDWCAVNTFSLSWLYVYRHRPKFLELIYAHIIQAIKIIICEENISIFCFHKKMKPRDLVIFHKEKRWQQNLVILRLNFVKHLEEIVALELTRKSSNCVIDIIFWTSVCQYQT